MACDGTGKVRVLKGIGPASNQGRKEKPSPRAGARTELVSVLMDCARRRAGDSAYNKSAPAGGPHASRATAGLGAFGEIEMIDSGLAKVLADEPSPAAAPDDESTLRAESQSLRDADDATWAGSVLGTPAFISPCSFPAGEPPGAGTPRRSARPVARRIGAAH